MNCTFLYIRIGRKRKKAESAQFASIQEYAISQTGLLRSRLLPVFAVLFGLFACQPIVQAAPSTPAKTSVSIIVKASPTASYETRIDIDSRPLLKQMLALEPVVGLAGEDSDVEIAVQTGGNTQSYRLTSGGNLFNAKNDTTLLPTPAFREKLNQIAGQLRETHYGKLIPWEQVSALIPKKDIVTVLDVETGLRFRAQRRAGSSHADVQPITKEDTRIMKQIYDGSWSWRRRAVIILTPRDRIAGSMHGMPHGGDGIPDNDFKGHFCIHFLGSVTHGRKNLDTAHQLMVMKAAGMLKPYLAEQEPHKLVELFVTAVNQHDFHTAGLMMNDEPGDPAAKTINEQELPEIDSIQPASMPKLEGDVSSLTAVDIPVRSVISRQHRRNEQRTLHFHLVRASESDPWRLDRIDVKAK